VVESKDFCFFFTVEKIFLWTYFQGSTQHLYTQQFA
jgi:hypothetical protein